MIKFRDNKIFVVGDTHGIRHFDRVLDDIPDHTDIVHIGDVGVGFFKNPQDDIRELERVGKKISNKGCRVFAIRGNHDDPEFWGTKFSALTLVPDYTPAVFPNGKTTLFVGGGISVDRIRRREGRSYWKGEVTTQPPEALDKCDIVFAHDCPNYVNHSTESLPEGPWLGMVMVDVDLMDDSAKQRGTLDRVAELVEPEMWIYGHFHNNLTYDIQRPWGLLQTRCMNICVIKSFDSETFEIEKLN